MTQYYHQTLGYLSSKQGFTLNNVRFPNGWLDMVSSAERQALGFHEVVYQGTRPDEQFYYVTEVRGQGFVTYQAAPKPMDTVFSDEGKVAVCGLRDTFILRCKTEAGQLLAVSDWKIIRAAEGGPAVDSETLEYRAAVRAVSNSYETAVLACQTVDDLASLGRPVWPAANQ